MTQSLPEEAFPKPNRRLRREELNSLAWDLALELPLPYVAGKHHLTVDRVKRLRSKPELKGKIDQCIEMRGFHPAAMASVIKLQGSDIMDVLVKEAQDPSSKNYPTAVGHCLPHLLPSTGPAASDPSRPQEMNHHVKVELDDKLTGLAKLLGRSSVLETYKVEDDPHIMGGREGLPTYEVEPERKPEPAPELPDGDDSDSP